MGRLGGQKVCLLIAVLEDRKNRLARYLSGAFHAA